MRGLLALTVLFVAVFGKETFEGHQVLRMYAKNADQLALINDLEDKHEFELDFWRGVTDVKTPVDVRVPHHNLQSVKTHLDSNAINYSIMIGDLQAMLDEERREMASAARVAEPKNVDSYDYARYHPINEIYSFQDMLVAENPKLVSKIVIGKSYEGRPLNVLKDSSPSSDQASGGTIDWTYNQGIKYSYTFELRDTGRYGFILPASQIIPTASETWLALMAIMDHAYKNPY
ncbi:carboxypeptidase A1-like [Notothenia coriiceps]|uniref:Carboxypeptidase A1 n=1 Tax=Notothenia coriiceps TaxID=8208 RepID=A0A6I9MSB2_9TELE|nr:PREDICTED: carboxypeptidase A1-like [Notothenia coriiceps]